MKKERLNYVEKVWGEEVILINSPKYCGKLLIVDKNAISSYHYHKTKQETFFAIEGYVSLTVEGKEELLAPFTRPKTIMPGEKHKFKGVSEAVILEVSTQHSDDDVVRLSESIKGGDDYGMDTEV